MHQDFQVKIGNVQKTNEKNLKSHNLPCDKETKFISKGKHSTKKTPDKKLRKNNRPIISFFFTFYCKI